MIDRAFAYVGAIAVLTVAVLYQLQHGESITASDVFARIGGPLALAVAVLLGLKYAFDRWLWRVLPTSFVKRPYLHGTWRITFQTSHHDPATGERRPPSEGYLVVEQTFSTLLIRFLPERSESRVLVCGFDSPQASMYRVVGVYLNTPPLEERDNSSNMHFGGMVLKVRGALLDELRGHYWTDREPQTKGTMISAGRRPELHDTFEAARAAFAPSEEENLAATS